jgi:hypothetical protein
MLLQWRSRDLVGSTRRTEVKPRKRRRHDWTLTLAKHTPNRCPDRSVFRGEARQVFRKKRGPIEGADRAILDGRSEFFLSPTTVASTPHIRTPARTIISLPKSPSKKQRIRIHAI